VVCAAGVAGDAMVCDPGIVVAWAFATQRAARGGCSDFGGVTSVGAAAFGWFRVEWAAVSLVGDAAAKAGFQDRHYNARMLSRCSCSRWVTVALWRIPQGTHSIPLVAQRTTRSTACSGSRRMASSNA
jgi:hypothetical protein